MTTIYELDKEATPGRMSSHKENHMLYLTADGHGVAKAVQSTRMISMEEGVATFTLLAHCRNHFMEALGLITELMLEIERDKGYTSDWAEEILKKLEAVE